MLYLIDDIMEILLGSSTLSRFLLSRLELHAILGLEWSSQSSIRNYYIQEIYHIPDSMSVLQMLNNLPCRYWQPPPRGSLEVYAPYRCPAAELCWVEGSFNENDVYFAARFSTEANDASLGFSIDEATELPSVCSSACASLGIGSKLASSFMLLILFSGNTSDEASALLGCELFDKSTESLPCTKVDFSVLKSATKLRDRCTIEADS
ncbi:hypothetical protein Lal_00006876 [Lupinus albus]|nr:hypothetical protein Lal_00006876 [Lupinus albus]